MSFLNRNNTASIHTSSSYAYNELDNPNTQRTNSSRSVMYTRDWRTALRTPPTYRIGNRTVRFNYHFALLVATVCALFVLFFYVRTGSTSSSEAAWIKTYASSTSVRSSPEKFEMKLSDLLIYNSTYPLTPPILSRGGSVTYRIAMVADLDTNSKVAKDDGSITWRSYLKKGYLTHTNGNQEIKVKWDTDTPIVLESSFSLKGRGMELSELVTFNGKLLTFDDRTGLIYEIVNDKVLPWIILLDGNGHNAKGFKSEWATVKQRKLYVGSMGKEWTTSMGDFENENPMFVKEITPTGEVRSFDWASNYKAVREQALQITWPGYMIHESGLWSEVHKKWYFLPRRCSKEKYNETRDEKMGCNVLISADERFSKIETVSLDPANTTPAHGFSSFKFIPNTEDKIILAIKSEELNGKTSTFITAFDLNGKTILPEQKIETDYKYEGIEFI
ncbi:apyrase [Teleopsis dalmanni]|uniref:apyrase n=1 Tax=Teleopsis dalmanni TaxID=139649 RepID=UPI0018CE7EE7|nr:apyrase [Teleopsis dalmanni]